MTDDLDDLLRPRTGPLPSSDVLECTTRIIRNRARWRLTMKACGLVVILLTGIAIGWSAKPNPEPRQVELPAPAATPPVIDDGSSFAKFTPDQFEQRAELADDTKEIAKFYKLAGDAYLARSRFDEASRCYRLHVTASRDTMLDRDDSWLLCSIKTTSLKEGIP